MSRTTPITGRDATPSGSALRRAKRPANILAGPYGHPVHAILITIPIGAWVASFVFDIVAFATGDDAFARGALLLVGIGLIGALAASIAGLMDLSRLSKGTRARRIALIHMALNLVVMVVFIASLLVRFGQDGDASVGATVLSGIGLLLLGASGFLGGELAYRYGVRVADEDTQITAYQHSEVR